jgi:transketolase
LRNQFARTLENIGASDEKLVVLLGDISVYLLRNFEQKFPDRFYNVGICEQTIMSMAAGLSSLGFYPVVHTITPFTVERCYEQIKIDLCYQKLGASIISVGSAFDYPASGCSHHCYEDFAVLRPLPGMEIVFPASEIEFDAIFKQTYNNGHTTYFRLPGAKHGIKFNEDQLRLGKGIKVKEGKALTVVVTGPELKNVVAASEMLDTEIIYIHTIKPLDTELVRQSVAKTGKVLTIEEHNVIGGLGDEVARAVGDIGNVVQSRLGIEDKFLTNYGSYQEHCAALGLDTIGIKRKIEGLL